MRSSPDTRRSAFAFCFVLSLAVAVVSLWPASGQALVRFDFEQKYFTHPGRQVWDFSVVRADSNYHIFYHSIPESQPWAANGDTIWHAVSPDLKHWGIHGPVLTADPGHWDGGALWAPSVARDDANKRWVMLYTGCDAAINQRIGLATSPDLETWTRLDAAVIEPDSTAYLWRATWGWSNFRDPFLYREDGRWHVLVTALQSIDGQSTGVIYHATSSDLINWTDEGPMFANDGANPAHVLESSQYHAIGEFQHLLFGEFDVSGISLVSARAKQDWSMADRVTIDAGNAPEVMEFDPGIHIFGRLAPYPLPQSSLLAYAVRFDTLRTAVDGSNPTVWRPNPLDEDWEVHTGAASLGNPCFGDNPRYRGAPSVGLVGNGWFGSREYYPGPLSGRGAPGAMLGDYVTGRLESRPFTVTGNQMTLLVGGGVFPATCYVALVDADDGTTYFSETGQGSETMTPRQWNLTPYHGRRCRIVIVDAESSTGGYINVDEIVESLLIPAAAPPAAPTGSLSALAIMPNPANPAAEIRFELAHAARVQVSIHDLSGRTVWTSGPRDLPAGAQSLVWRGVTRQGTSAPSGTYLVRVTADDGAVSAAPLTLLK